MLTGRIKHLQDEYILEAAPGKCFLKHPDVATEVSIRYHTVRMPSDDRIGVITPEAVEFTFDLSGLASRVLALLVDLLIQAVLIIGLLVGWGLMFHDDSMEMLGSAVIVLVVSYLFNWAYFLFFEMIWNGRSPGKRLMGCRVIRDGGLPVNFIASLIRNFLRPIDYLLSSLMIGFFIIFASPTYKRLGDLAAGTMVITERKITLFQLLSEKRTGAFNPTYSPLGLFTKADIAVLSQEQVDTIRRFLERRNDIPEDKRARFATDLFAKVVKIIPEADGHGLNVEQVLEEIILAVEEREADDLARESSIPGGTE